MLLLFFSTYTRTSSFSILEPSRWAPRAPSWSRSSAAPPRLHHNPPCASSSSNAPKRRRWGGERETARQNEEERDGALGLRNAMEAKDNSSPTSSSQLHSKALNFTGVGESFTGVPRKFYRSPTVGANTIIAGGTDTSNTALTWAVCLILKNPLVIQKVKAELDIQIGKERYLSESDISKLIYLQAIVKETLRLHPPVPLSAPHEFTEDCTLSGYNIKKGTRLITNIWKIHTYLNVWSDPIEFKPERFLTTHKDINMRGHHFDLLPFGSGRRICPGIFFGLQMLFELGACIVNR
ncbi:Cytochrome P450 82A4, partial [Mucuna pruriens]